MQRTAIASTAAVLLAIATVGASAAEKPIKRALTKEDWAYAMPAGVVAREVTY